MMYFSQRGKRTIERVAPESELLMNISLCFNKSASGGCVPDLCIDGDQQIMRPSDATLDVFGREPLSQLSAVEMALRTKSYMQDFTADAAANRIFRR